MLTEAFPKIENSKIVRVLRAYFRSVWHIAIVVALMACAEIFSWEIPVYYCYLALGILVCLFGEDLLGIVVMAPCCYMSLSVGNTPSHNAEAGAFGDPAFLVHFGFIAIVGAIFLIARLICKLARREKRGVPKLTAGFLLLGIAFILGGLFSPYYSAGTALIGLMHFALWCGLYFYFYFTVNWKDVEKGYALKMLAVIGAGLALEILSMYFREGVVADGVVQRGSLWLGWGHYNTAGCIMAMCVPAAFYFAITMKHGWIMSVLANTYMLCVVLSQSRGAMLFGGIVYLVCVIVLFVKTKKMERIFHLIVFGVFLIAAAVCVPVFWGNIKDFFTSIFTVGFDDNNRIELFQEAWGYFKANPFFGAGWGGEHWTGGFNLLDPFWAHNTYCQLIGSGGLLLLVAYLFHRIQTLFILFRHRTMEKYFIALAIGVIILTCIMDCHLFVFGPAMIYSVLLGFLEGADKRTSADLRLRLRKRKMKVMKTKK